MKEIQHLHKVCFSISTLSQWSFIYSKTFMEDSTWHSNHNLLSHLNTPILFLLCCLFMKRADGLQKSLFCETYSQIHSKTKISSLINAIISEKYGFSLLNLCLDAYFCTIEPVYSTIDWINAHNTTGCDDSSWVRSFCVLTSRCRWAFPTF